MQTENTDRGKLERMLIAGLLTNYNELVDYMKISPKDFTAHHQKIMSSILKEQSGDITLLSSKYGLDSNELWDIAGEVMFFNPLDYQKYVECLKDMIDRGNIIDVLKRSEMNVKGYGSVREVYLDIWNTFKGVEGYNDKGTKDAIDDIMSEIKGEKEVKIIPTGYRDLDKLIGGFEKGQIVVAGARPGVGKSMIAINLMMNNVRMGEKVALFSMEMLNKQILRRLLALVSGVSVWKLKTKLEGYEFERVQKGITELKELLGSMYLIDDCGTIGEIEGKIRYLVHKEKVSVIYIDYLQLIRNPNVKNNPVESITDISQRLKQLALQLGITIVELSQLNRASDQTAIKRASQLRGSGSIEQDADIIWILDKLDEDSDKIQLSVQKCRDGKIGEIELQQNSDIMQITNTSNKIDIAF